MEARKKIQAEKCQYLQHIWRRIQKIQYYLNESIYDYGGKEEDYKDTISEYNEKIKKSEILQQEIMEEQKRLVRLEPRFSLIYHRYSP